ncbi:MAG: glyoxalase [Hyphobacterium sp.]|nr:MAG: glyoxalase [Hyphobacterium sp.]
MKRFHLNLNVTDLDKSMAFYNELFAAEPAVVEDDYAKWMLDDPFINFSISTRGAKTGIDHIGIEASDENELAMIRERLVRADSPILDEDDANCCYANSKKAWISDPDGVAWETFFSKGRIANYGDGTGEVPARIAAEGKPATERTGTCC